MAKVKYRIREFKPTANQTGGHSVYAEALGFDKSHGCQGVYEYLKTGVFPERGRK
jgi:hypothetical protein